MSETSFTTRKIEAHTIYSAHLSEERTLKVYLPPDYDPARSYPSLYCHDGLEFFTHGRIATLANELIARGELEPVFIIGIAVQKSTRTEDYAPKGDRHFQYSRFVVDECLPFIEDRYAVHRDACHRFMGGSSLGATAALSIHVQNPDVFRQLLLFSGAYYPSSQAQVKAQTHLSDLAAYMVVGRQETAVETAQGSHDFYQLNHTMRDLLRVRGAAIDYNEADGTHTWGFWQRQIPDSLRWMQRRLRVADGQ